MTNEQINDGGPAFPSGKSEKCGFENSHPLHEGMSLRDWFAGQEKIDPSEEFGWGLLEALAGPRPVGGWRSNPIAWFHWSNLWQAKIKFARADAMLAARSEGGK